MNRIVLKESQDSYDPIEAILNNEIYADRAKLKQIEKIWTHSYSPLPQNLIVSVQNQILYDFFIEIINGTGQFTGAIKAPQSLTKGFEGVAYIFVLAPRCQDNENDCPFFVEIFMAGTQFNLNTDVWEYPHLKSCNLYEAIKFANKILKKNKYKIYFEFK